MSEVAPAMIKYHNSVSRVLKIHYRGCNVCAYILDGSKIYGEVDVERGGLYINRELMDDKIITGIFHINVKGSGKKLLKKEEKMKKPSSEREKRRKTRGKNNKKLKDPHSPHRKIATIKKNKCHHFF